MSNQEQDGPTILFYLRLGEGLISRCGLLASLASGAFFLPAPGKKRTELLTAFVRQDPCGNWDLVIVACIAQQREYRLHGPGF